MNEKALNTLEYTKILARLEEFAATPSGKEKCRNLTPMTDIREIRAAAEQTSDALSRILKKGALSFGGVKDIRDSLMRLQIGSALSIHELLNIASLLEAADRAVAYNRKDTEETPSDSLDSLFERIEPLSHLCREIRRCLPSEEEVSDDASPGLRQVRRRLRSAQERVHTQLNSVLNASRPYLQDGVITMRDGRYCLPVKAEYKARFPGMVHDQSSTGSTFFIEPMAIVKLNNEIRELQIKEQQEIEAVLTSLSSRAAEETEALSCDFHALCELDFIFAKGQLSRRQKGSEPLFNTEGRIHLKDARHPLLDPEKVVPVELFLGDTFDLLIVTGPNTGGKTVSLKTAGLLTLMGQAGLHIPAFQGSELAVFAEVYADIGDEQSIEQSLSTFSAHMTNIVSFLEKADQNSLVLFDELGAGTDPVEGAALATAILDSLLKRRVRTMATTHYSELKIYALSTERVENASCEFDVESLRPTYRLLIGVPGKSNAFAISKKLGLPDAVIEEARNYIGEQEEAFEDVLSDLENTRKALESEREEAARYKDEISRLKNRLSRTENNLEERRERLTREADEEARRIVSEAKAFADETIRRINKLTNDSDLRRELEKERQSLNQKLNAIDQKRLPKTPSKAKAVRPENLHIGDAVRVLSMNVKGTVSTLPNAKGELYVQMGILRSLIHIKDLELVQEATVSGPGMEKKRSHASRIKVSKSLSVSPELNIIGMTTDEAVPLVDKYIDDAYLAHLGTVRIIHGRGTGALKNAVHNLLKKTKHVKSYRLGSFGEGDAGVTIAELDYGQKS
ncbi:MAG: endonuclease MutS2 [Lachnospiraceae bacterium]|nr:endonuclease MutS2 [Lachnospiraceae bacterium]